MKPLLSLVTATSLLVVQSQVLASFSSRECTSMDKQVRYEYFRGVSQTGITDDWFHGRRKAELVGAVRVLPFGIQLDAGGRAELVDPEKVREGSGIVTEKLQLHSWNVGNAQGGNTYLIRWRLELKLPGRGEPLPVESVFECVTAGGI